MNIIWDTDSKEREINDKLAKVQAKHAKKLQKEKRINIVKPK